MFDNELKTKLLRDGLEIGWVLNKTHTQLMDAANEAWNMAGKLYPGKAAQQFYCAMVSKFSFNSGKRFAEHTEEELDYIHREVLDDLDNMRQLHVIEVEGPLAALLMHLLLKLSEAQQEDYPDNP